MKEKTLFWLFVGILFITIVLLICSSAKAEICYDANVAGGMVTEIEQCRIMQDEMQIMQGMVDSLQTQLSLIEEKTKLLQDSLDKSQRELTIQEVECNKKIKEAKPTFTQKVGTAVTWGIIGGLVFKLISLFIL